MRNWWILCSVVLIGVGISSTVYSAFQQTLPICATSSPVTLSVREVMNTADARMGTFRTPSPTNPPYPTFTPHAPLLTARATLSSIPPTSSPLDITAIHQTATALSEIFSRTSTPTERGQIPTITLTYPPVPTLNPVQWATQEANFRTVQQTATTLAEQLNPRPTYVAQCASVTPQP